MFSIEIIILLINFAQKLKQISKIMMMIDEVTFLINAITDEKIKKSAEELLELIKKHTQLTPKIVMKNIIGFGDYHYQYESGREGDTFLIGFSPRKKNITLYFTFGLDNIKDEIMRLGKHTTGKSCVYINKIEDIDTNILGKIIEKSIQSNNH